MREEVLEVKFTELLKGISFGADVLNWVTAALRDSHHGQKQFHEEAISKLQQEHRRIQSRIDAMYMDKLDARIDNEFFDRNAGDFHSEQSRLMREIGTHQSANQTYIDEGVQILELAGRRPGCSRVSRRSKNGNCSISWFRTAAGKMARLQAEYRKPFDLIASAALADRQLRSWDSVGSGDFDNWRRERDSNPR